LNFSNQFPPIDQYHGTAARDWPENRMEIYININSRIIIGKARHT